MTFEIRGNIYHKNGIEQPVIFTVDAADKKEARFFFRHGIQLQHVPEDATSSLDFRTLKKEQPNGGSK